MIRGVLLVDDDEFARGFARTVLERAGYEVHEAEDVATALVSADSFLPVAVVTDWRLPDGDGIELAQRIRERLDDLPVILMTGDSSVFDPPESSMAVFSKVLHKPFPPSALERAIREAVEE
jgi:DNA-binding response OmpR family regulator